MKELGSVILFWVVLISTFVITMWIGQYIVNLGVQIVVALQNVL